MNRRQFLFSSLAAAGMTAAGSGAAAPPLRFGHRQANMVNQPGPEVFDLAKKIKGLSGVELQVFFKNTKLWDKDTLSAYLSASKRTGLVIPSLAGIWPIGLKNPLFQPTAEEHIRKAVQAAEAAHAGTILLASFEGNCPQMDKESSYGPVVQLLQKVSGAAKDAGVVIGMETSNSPADDRKLIELVNRPSIQVYYDLDNVERYEHTGQAVPGIKVLDKMIRQVHLKNEDRLLDQPGRVKWADAVKGLKEIGYNRWFVFETSHSGPEQCIEATEKNIEFVKQHYV